MTRWCKPGACHIYSSFVDTCCLPLCFACIMIFHHSYFHFIYLLFFFFQFLSCVGVIVVCVLFITPFPTHNRTSHHCTQFDHTVATIRCRRLITIEHRRAYRNNRHHRINHMVHHRMCHSSRCHRRNRKTIVRPSMEHR